MAKGVGNKKRFQCCTDPSGEILYLRALQGHSGRNLIDPSLQDNVLIQYDFFEYLHHVGCAINLLSIKNSGLIPGGQNLSKRQTVFFLPVDPMEKNHEDPETDDLKAPRLAQYIQTAWKKHQNTVYWVDIKLAQKKGLKFYQTRQNAIILYNTLPAPVMAEQSDTLFELANLLIMTPRPSIEIPAQEKLLQKDKERVERLPQQDTSWWQWNDYWWSS